MASKFPPKKLDFSSRVFYAPKNMQSFNHFLREIGVENDLRSLFYHIARSVKYINFSIRAGNLGSAESENPSGESQVPLDILSDQIISRELEKSELAAVIASEEQSDPVFFPSPRGKFAVAFDPLDGSSLVDCNLAIGSVFGIWKKPAFLGQKVGENMVGAAFAVYGPRITIVIAVKNLGVHEFELNDVGEFMRHRKNLTVLPDATHFAPGNLRAAAENSKYKSLLDHWVSSQKTLRYSGGMVPDLNHILCKKNGVFVYPSSQKYPNGKLRLLFECAPMALIFDEAGGAAKDENGQNILDLQTEKIHQTTSLLIGSENEVDAAVNALS